jgi:predicted PurR-regulated permease PerM
MKQTESTAADTDSREWVRLPAVRAFAVVVATLICLYVCYLLAVPFLPALTWALTVAVLAAPLHRRLERKLHSANASAAISVGLLALVVIIPVTLMGQQLLGEVSSGAASVQKQFADGEVQRTIDSYPLIRKLADLIEQQIDLKAILGNAATWLTNFGKSVLQGSLTYLITLLLTFYFLFFFLRDREDALRQLKMLSPLTEAETDRLFARVSDTIQAVIFGTGVTAMLQGTLGGVMFWLLGLPNALFWGLVMTGLAVIPVLGTFVIWIPAAAYLALSGDWGKAAILTAWGGIVIAGVDNLLYPILAGGRLRMPTVPMFISIVGGVILFGASGIVLGPLTVTTTLSLLEIWRARSEAKQTA